MCPNRMHGTIVYLPTCMVDLYGKCRAQNSEFGKKMSAYIVGKLIFVSYQEEGK